MSFKRIIDTAFDMDAPVPRDDSVGNYQYFAYKAIDPNASGRIDLQVQDKSKYFLPCEAYIEVEGRILRDNPRGAYPANTRVGFVNNGIMALFEGAKYMIDGNDIESINNGIDMATTIIGLARYSDDYTRSAGPSMMFAKDTSDHANTTQYIMARPTEHGNPAAVADIEPLVMGSNPDYNLGQVVRNGMLKGAERKFSCVIPLSHIFGFCRHVRKVIYGAKHTVVLQRRSDANSAIWRIPADATSEDTKAADDAIVELSKLILWMPVLTPSLAVNQRLLSWMETGASSLISWLNTSTDSLQSNQTEFTWNLAGKRGISAPRHIFIALQRVDRTSGRGQQSRSHMIFDWLDVTEVSLRINGQQEPAEPIKLRSNADENNVARVYHRLWSFMGRDQNVDTGLQISQHDFQTLYPIYYFSLEHLDLTKESVVDITFNALVGQPGAGYRAFAVLLSDKSMLIEGMGGQMRLIDAPVENL